MIHESLEKKWNMINQEFSLVWNREFTDLKLSFQQQNILLDIFIDAQSWKESDLVASWPKQWVENHSGKILTGKVVSFYQDLYAKLRTEKKAYPVQINPVEKSTIKFGQIGAEDKVLGACPVASEKTRCCNLLTLDVVRSCGFDCTYCSIQSFFNDDQVDIETNLTQKLNSLELDPTRLYHIGTGQSSDSLMWGNKDGILDELMSFARANPNVLLEFKTKSHNINYFVQNDIPKNILLTWSLNPQCVIDVEERLTASLEQRLKSAKLVADKGILVGFHFHPMIYFDNYEQEYGEIASFLTKNFTAQQVALVSLGTVTFTKKVIKKIRERSIYTKILQMDMIDAEGKLSYSLDVKKEMFKELYSSLSDWHNKVYFYLCMEDKSLWSDVFGHEYESNDAFEQDMISSYFSKVDNLP